MNGFTVCVIEIGASWLRWGLVFDVKNFQAGVVQGRPRRGGVL